MLKKNHGILPPFVIILIKLFGFQVVAFSVFRLIFYFGMKPDVLTGVTNQQIAFAFLRGLNFDILICTYALVLPFLLLLLNDIFSKRTPFFLSTIARWWVIVAYTLMALVSVADLPYFRQFNNHLNRHAFLWTDSPGFVLGLIFGTFSIYGFLILFAVQSFIIYRVVQYVFKKYAVQLSEIGAAPRKTIVWGFVLVPFIVGGVRGRVSSKSVLHEGMTIVSDNMFLNSVALNPNYSLMKSLAERKTKHYVAPHDIDISIAIARKFSGIKGPYERSVDREQGAGLQFKPFNVVLVCMESMDLYKMGKHKHEVLTPQLNALVKESIFFDNFFSSGIHTFNGLFSTCTGYPSLLNEHALKQYIKKPFTTLGNLLGKKGYDTYFLSTHDPHFDNMQGFFTLNGYKTFLSSVDLPFEKNISVTGVPDHEIFDLLLQTIDKRDAKQPFHAFVMTGSDHGPWVIPNDIPFQPHGNTKEKKSTQYSDWAIGEFMKKAKTRNWYSNTLFVFLGDHGHSLGESYEMPLSFHNVPFILHKPDTFKPDTIHSPAYQPDVLSTVAGALNLEFTNSSFGIDLLKETHAFVYFTADDKIGCLNDQGYYFYELIPYNAKRLRKYPTLDWGNYYDVKKDIADSLERSAKAMLDAAEYFINRDYFIQQ